MKSLRLITIVVLLVAFAVSPTVVQRTHSESFGAISLRVMTYNIHVGIGMDKKLDLARIAEVINREKPDLVGLQEVDRGVQRTQRVDQIAELARMTKMEFAFAHNLNYQGGQYGVAILSRFPFVEIDHKRYRNLREAERRGYIRMSLRVNGRLIDFVTTHLDYQYADGRLFEARQLLRELGPVRIPLIVVGDFNDEPSGDTYKEMRNRFGDAWSEKNGEDLGFTYPTDNPAKRIDYVFFSRGDGIRVKRAWITKTDASDHLPLIVDLEIPVI